MTPKCRPIRGLSILAALALTGCATIDLETEGGVVDRLVSQLRSDDSSERQRATGELLTRQSVSVRHIVIPRLALESALVPLEISSRDGNIVRGRVTGGDDKTLSVQITKRVARDAIVTIPLAEIKLIRLSR